MFSLLTISVHIYIYILFPDHLVYIVEKVIILDYYNGFGSGDILQ